MGTEPAKYYSYYVLLVFFTGNLSYQGVTDPLLSQLIWKLKGADIQLPGCSRFSMV